MALVAELVSISLSDKCLESLLRGAAPSPGPSPALLLEAAVCSQGLSRSVAHLQRKKAVRDLPCGCVPEMPSFLEPSAAVKKTKTKTKPLQPQRRVKTASGSTFLQDEETPCEISGLAHRQGPTTGTRLSTKRTQLQS